MDDLRKTRDNDKVERSLEALRQAARGRDNTMYPLLDCVRVCDRGRSIAAPCGKVWGEYEEVPLI